VNQNRPITPVLAFGWTLSVAFALLFTASLIASARPSAATDAVTLGAVEAAVFLLGISALLRLHGKDVSLAASVGLRPTHAALPFLGMLLGFTVHFPAEAVDVFIQRFSPDSANDIAQEVALLTSDSPVRFALVLFFIACVAPLVEELFFRGALFGALRRGESFATTTVVIAACFVTGHLGQWRRWPALLVVALVMTYVRAVSGSLLPSIALHVVFNAVTVVFFALGQVPTPESRHIEVPETVGFTFVTAVLLFAVRYVASRAALARRGRAEDAE
jgi:membrane protease YdiL (CAAX protease family)